MANIDQFLTYSILFSQGKSSFFISNTNISDESSDEEMDADESDNGEFISIYVLFLAKKNAYSLQLVIVITLICPQY